MERVTIDPLQGAYQRHVDDHTGPKHVSSMISEQIVTSRTLRTWVVYVEYDVTHANAVGISRISFALLADTRVSVKISREVTTIQNLSPANQHISCNRYFTKPH
jgi:hypothetical protein